MSNYTIENLIPAAAASERIPAIKVGTKVFPMLSGGTDVTLGVVNSEGKFQAFSFNGTTPTDSGTPETVTNYKTWNSTLPAPTPTPEGSSNVITPVGDAEFGFRNNMGTSFFVNSYGTWLNNDTRSDWGVSGGTVFRTSTVADVGDDWHGTAGNNSVTNFFLWWTINRETVVKGYQCLTLENNGYGMTEWVLQGSNDGSTWTTIHTGTASAPSDNSKIRYFSTSSNSTAYLCYRIKPVSINNFPFVGSIRAFSEDIGEVYLEPQSN